MQRNQRTIFLTGLVLVCSGVALVFVSLVGAKSVVLYIPIVAGVALCVTGGAVRIPGLFLPGALLVGAGTGIAVTSGLGETASEAVLIGVFLAAIGFSFSLVPLLSRISGWELVMWPFIPGGALGLCGVGLVFSPDSSGLARMLAKTWPGVVAFSVVWLVLVFYRRKQKPL